MVLVFKNKKLFPPFRGCDKRKMMSTGLLLLSIGSWAEPEIRNQVPVVGFKGSAFKGSEVR
jgi:hypothetical protein